MPTPIQPPSLEIMQPFDIPTNVTPTVRTGPRPQLEFPVFRPPEASSYGSTQPMAIPWQPPNLVGAIQSGLELGGKLATDYMANRKTAQEIAAEEAVAKPAIAAMNDPRMAAYRGFSVGPGGFTGTLISPAEAALRQAQIASEQARAGAERAQTEATYGRTAPAQSEIAAREAGTQKTQAETRVEQQRILSGFDIATGAVPSGNAAVSGVVQRPPATDQSGASTTATDQGDGQYLNLNY